MEYEFTAQMIEWRGPAPFYYLPMPHDMASEIKAMASQLTYGWGVIPVKVTIGKTTLTTSLFPKDGTYLVPVKNAIRLPEGLTLGQSVRVRLEFAT